MKDQVAHTTHSSSNLSLNHLEPYINFFRPIPWQTLGTYTFPSPISDSYAAEKFAVFMDCLEKSLRCPIAYIRGDERDCCLDYGKPWRHYHALFAAAVRLNVTWVANTWVAIAGQRPGDVGADVSVYDPAREGLAYCLKRIFGANGGWDLRNLDLFLPDPGNMNRRKRRRLRRNAQRAL